MSSSHSLPEDYLLNLWDSAFSSDTHVPSTNIDIRKGGGNTETESISRRWEEDIEIDTTDEVLYFLKDGMPTAFRIRGKGSLVDGTGHYVVDGGWLDDDYFIETLAVSYRPQISDNPIALVTDRLFIDGGSSNNVELLEYSPYVLIFKDKLVGTALKQERSEGINAANNDYWEANFQYDINQDGFIPAYRVFDSYQKPTKDGVNGQVIIGKKKNEALEGGDLDDYINGKKGNDVITGYDGNDVLLGNKGRDQLYGLSGDDYLSGGAGDDFLEGGEGADVFALSQGNDQIIDFSLRDGDKIFIQGEYVSEFVMTYSDSGSLLSVDNYGSFELDVNLVDVDVIDFIVTT